MKHTPGPWRQGTFNKNIVLCCSGGEELPICGCNTRSVISEGEETEANARLIAAAPDLLQACRMARRILEAIEGKMIEGEGVYLMGELTQLDRAIVKAEG